MSAEAKDRQDGVKLCLKFNNCATNDPCATCGDRTDPEVGCEVFVDGTWALVCDKCVLADDPGLLKARDILRAHNEELSRVATAGAKDPPSEDTLLASDPFDEAEADQTE